VTLLGVDAGGSHTEAVVTNHHLSVLARAHGGPGWAGDLSSATPNIRATVAKALAGLAKPSVAVIGAAGAGNPTVASALADGLRDLADTVHIVTDIAIALADAFPDGPGIVLLAGTGSVAMARHPGGRVVRAGGKGPGAGDEGSGYWLGKAALAAGLVTALGTDRPTIAALASQVLRLAAAGNPMARQLVHRAANALAALVQELALDADVVLAGGLLREGPLRAELMARLPRVQDRAVDPALGAARMAAHIVRKT
jgi:N-acetylglucosamine kinase-like BadF-type ATPase